jgi:hypothetical protein
MSESLEPVQGFFWKLVRKHRKDTQCNPDVDGGER